MNTRYLCLAALIFVFGCQSSLTEKGENVYLERGMAKKKPNIIVILADDMGFSDIGCFGSEIKTPNLDSLAYKGLRLTQFYNAGRCCPSRAALLTGQYPHRVGIGEMINGSPIFPRGYSGILSDSALTIPEVLNPAGYRSYLSGKWHLAESTLEAPHPMDRGFHRFFGLMEGASSYYNRGGYRKAEDSLTFMVDRKEYKPEEGFYMTNAIADHALEFLGEHATDHAEDPFFLYLSFTAPHWPLHAPEEEVAAYQGQYDAGWDKIREERYANQLAMDIIPKDFPLSTRNPEVKPWDSIPQTEKSFLTREMEVYAAMMSNMDRNIGRLVSYLKSTKQLDNTFIVFLSDNGGCHEDVEDWTPAYEHPKKAGPEGSFESYGKGWANVSNTPFRWFKSWVHEGGVSTPFIVHYPDGLQRSGIYAEQYAHITDLLPTLVDLAGAEYPDRYQGTPRMALPGKSLMPLISGKDYQQRPAVFWEHMGNMAVREGDWKLVARKRNWEGDTVPPMWELYNMQADRSEQYNLAEEMPAKAEELKAHYQEWADEVGVIPYFDYHKLRQKKVRYGTI